MSPGLSTGSAGISIVTPGDWEEFDLDPATRHRSVARAVRRACAHDRSLESGPLITFLDGLVGCASDSGGFYLAAAAGRGDGNHPFASSVFMQAGPATAAYRSSPTLVCADYAADLASDPSLADCDVSVVSLPALGPAVRVEGSKQGVQLNYLAPLHSPACDLLVSFSAPCWMSPERQVATLTLFETMARSIAFVPSRG